MNLIILPDYEITARLCLNWSLRKLANQNAKEIQGSNDSTRIMYADQNKRHVN